MSSQSVSVLLCEAAALGDDSSVSQILSERLLTVEEASKPDPRLNSTYFGLTALHRARTPEVARVLLDFGVPVNCKGPLGQTPLHTCCDNPPVLKLLLSYGADIDATTDDGSTVLEWAVVADCLDSVKLLIESGADVQAANSNGNTPLHLVSSRKMCELLLQNGAKVSTENLEGKIPLETAAERKGEPDFAAITELLLDVSEDRGLRYRTKKRLQGNGSANASAADSFGERLDTKARVRKRWSLVRDKFLHKKAERSGSSRSISSGATGRPRAGTKEWYYGQPGAGSSAGQTSSRSLLDTIQDDDEETAADDNEIDYSADGDVEKGEHSGFYMRFFELAIQERPFLAKKMLDRHRTFLYAKGTAKYYSYDLSLLGGIDSVSNALRLIVECDRRELAAHDLVQWLVTAKWGLFTQRHMNREGFLYLLFVVMFTASSLASHFGIAHYRRYFDVVLLLLALRFVARLLVEWYHRGLSLEVAHSIWRADRWTGPVFLIELVTLFLRYVVGFDENSTIERVLETAGSVMLWVRVLYFAEAQIQTVGLTMSIVRRMIADIFVYVCVQWVFLVAFTHAMTIVFRGQDVPDANFGTPSASLSTLGFFIFNLDMTPVYSVEDPGRRAMAMLLVAMYESLVVVVFLNLVIAVMTTSFDDVMSNAKTEWLLVRAKICVRMEDQSSAGLFSSREKRHIRKLQAKRSVVVMEKADGENEVSLPVSLLPPPMDLKGTTLAVIDYLKHLSGQRRIAAAAEASIELPQVRLQRQASSTRTYGTIGSVGSPINLKRSSSQNVVDSITGMGEEVFVVGSFMRYAVAFQQQQQQQSQGSQSVSSVASMDSADVSAKAVTDEKLLQSLKTILTEMERRQQNRQVGNDL